MRLYNPFTINTFWWLSVLFRPYLRAVEGKEHIPVQPFIIAANHQGPMDPLFLLTACMCPIHFVATHTLKEKNSQSLWWWHWFWVFTIGRAIPTGGNGVKKSIARLRQGHTVGIFPEGRIHPSVPNKKIGSGVAVISHKSQVPILPIHIIGSGDIWPITNSPVRMYRFHSVDIHIGEPIAPPSLDTTLGKEDYQCISANIVKIINGL